MEKSKFFLLFNGFYLYIYWWTTFWGVANNKFLNCDIFDKNTKRQIADYFKGDLDVIISDMAADTTGNKSLDSIRTNQLCSEAIDFSTKILKKNVVFVSKLFMGDDFIEVKNLAKSTFKELNFFDVCYVKYKKREHNFIKIFVSRLNNIVSSFLMNKSYKIYTSSFKCFKKSVRDKIISNKEDFIFLDYWIFQYTKKITFIYVSHNKRHQGNTNYGFRELLTLWSRMIFLIKFKIMFLILSSLIL